MVLAYSGLDCAGPIANGQGTLTRQGSVPPEGNNNLQSLTISPLNAPGLTPSFSPTTTNYTAVVASAVSSVTVTALPAGNASVVINNQTITSRSVTLNAAGTSTTITIAVTAAGGSPKTYTVTINR